MLQRDRAVSPAETSVSGAAGKCAVLCQPGQGGLCGRKGMVGPEVET